MLSDMRTMKMLILSALVVIASLVPGAPAAAQSGMGMFNASPVRLYGGAWLGFMSKNGEHQSVDPNHPVTALGGQFGLDVIGESDVFSLGFETRIGATKFNNTSDRTKLVDFAIKPRLRLYSEGEPVELYVTVPVGVTVPRFNDTGAPGAPDIGWNLGVGGGVNLFLSESFGLNIEPMWLRHTFKVNGGPDLTVKQFALFLNAVLPL